MNQSGRRPLLLLSLGAVVVVAGALLAVLVVVATLDFGPWSARLAGRALGRSVTIDSLRIRLHRRPTVELHGLTLANAATASAGPMATAKSAILEFSLGSLLKGKPVIGRLTLDGVHLLLEHDRDDRPNWIFPGGSVAVSGRPEEWRAATPTVLDLALADLRLEYRTASGALLAIRVDRLAARASGPAAPITVSASGAYNDLPIALQVQAESADALRSDRPYGVSARLQSGDTVLAFTGALEDPFGVDRATGRAVLNAPGIAALSAFAEVPAILNAPLTLAGQFGRTGDEWRLVDGIGTIAGRPFTAAIRLNEGPHKGADSLSVESHFTNLDLDAMKLGGDAGSTDTVALTVDPRPGTLITAHVAADTARRRSVDLTGLDVAFAVMPGVITVDRLAASLAGGTVTGALRLANVAETGEATFDAALEGVDLQRLVRMAGVRVAALSGPLNARIAGRLVGTDIGQTRRNSRAAAILTMNGGTVDRTLVRMASTDLRALFGRSGRSSVSCLAVLMDMRDGRVSIAPLRLTTTDGTIVGDGTFDPVARRIDLVLGSRASSTGIFALDIPIHVSGPLADYAVAPAIGSVARRLDRPVTIAQDLPESVRAEAEAARCLGGGKRR